MKNLPTHQSLLFFKDKSLINFIFFNLLSLLLQELDHWSFLILFNFEYFGQRHQIFILLLSKINSKAWQFYIEYLFIFILIPLIIDHKIHIVDNWVDSLFHSAIFESIALFDKGIVPQKRRIDYHRKFLEVSVSMTLDSQTTKMQAPTLIFVERANEHRTVDIQLHI